ncbi:hypothetical protein PTSG_02193 [Salpingoeca rosetta]|uniref:Mis18 domain-containing protein n=1 Tax=Salpingoeca rosetta (strain ATCC 50818 / BSB-021) TaxID=946362 RepID=F2U1H3_SALR5|nr:uncharacterized protein PTSG_02193 [Salpingoeca rosetta]EGD81475.1 hypothetical protein PTSG_02193 [Salpingoeca rosetta]|eukprot:XP_004996679.1 hypothetical protein PTSG_02193 [Salpingoeca rosetta]
MQAASDTVRDVQRAEGDHQQQQQQQHEGQGEESQKPVNGEEEEEEEDGIDAPLVFQCAACRAVVGDSFAWVCSDQDLNTITLTGAAPGVKINGQLETSTQGRDLGSTYVTFQCSCGAILGRVYQTTARHLDHMRDLMTFDLDALTSYKLGSVGVSADENDELTFPSAIRMKEDIGKIQLLMITHDEKLSELQEKVAHMEHQASIHQEQPQTRSSKRSKRK